MAFASIICARGSIVLSPRKALSRTEGNASCQTGKRSITRSTIVSRKGMRLLPVDMPSHPLTMKQALEADHHFRI